MRAKENYDGKFLLPMIALGMASYAAYYIVGTHPSTQPPFLPAPPVESPFALTVCGIGVVESATDNISIGAALPGKVREVQVTVGQRVQVGEVLIRLDDREPQARLKARQAALDVAEKRLARLEQLPREEELPAKLERIQECKAHLEFQIIHFQRV